MKKCKRILSIMTSVAMAGSVFGCTFASSKVAYAKINTKNGTSSIEAVKDNHFINNSLQTEDKFNKINIEKTKNNINYTAPEFNVVASSSTKMTTSRLSGKSRYETAANIAEAGWMGTSDYAIIATGENFPDALCAAPLAAKYNAPIILTESGVLNDNAKKELERLQVKNVIIVGGVGAISQNTENSIKALGIDITRISGKNRYDTSEKIAEQVGPSSEIVMATGNNFPDALSIAGIAAMKGMPILLTDVNTIPAETQVYLNENKTTITKTYVVGGIGVISAAVCESLKNSKRLSGNNRYDTNAAITSLFGSHLNSGNVYIATGMNFPDALACSALAPLTCSPIILADEGSETAAQSYVTTNIGSMGTAIAIGGTGAVSDTVLNNATGNYGRAYNNQVVTSPFKDTNLERAVRDTIKKPSGDLYKSDFNSIIVLSAKDYEIKDIAGIDNLTNVSALYFGIGSNGLKANSISDVTILKNPKKLKALDISSNSFNNLSTLNELTNLRSLDLSYNKIIDISALNGLTNLQQLFLNYNQISDISIVKGLTNLNELNLTDNQISDISAIKELTNLQQLFLESNQIIDIGAITGLSNLQILYLQDNQISDISALKGLTNLQTLILSNNQISNISAIKGLNNLHILYLSNNKISDITDLKRLTNLMSLNLAGNSISDADKTALKSALPKYNINFN